MYRSHLVLWLLLAGAARGSDCRVVTGPDGLCAAIRLEPRHVDLHRGGTLRIRTTGLDCTHGFDCIDCTHRRRRVHWSSSAPDVAAVDSTGLVRAAQAGTADIQLISEELEPQPLASMRVAVSQ